MPWLDTWTLEWQSRVAYATFYVNGMSNVVAWMSYMLCMDYFSLAYPHGLVTFVFPIVNMSTLLFVTIAMLMGGRNFTVHSRMYGGLFTQLFCLLFVPFVAYMPLSAINRYFLTVLCLAGCAFGGSIAQSTSYGLGGIFGPSFLQALEGGKGLSGVLLVIIRCWVKSDYKVIPGNPSQLFPFFAISCGVVTSAIILFYLMNTLEFVKHKNAAKFMEDPKSIIHDKQTVVDELSSLVHTPKIGERNHRQQLGATNLIRSLWKPCFVIFGDYFVCLACFPGLTMSLKSTTLNLGDWLPVILVASFNIGDLMGKSLPGMFQAITKTNLSYFFFIQLCYVPMFLLSTQHPLGDILDIVLVFSLGVSTGYIGTSCLMLIPSFCDDDCHRDQAGIIGSLCLIVGLFMGSYAGLLLDLLVITYL